MGGGGSQTVKTKVPWYQEETGKTLYKRGTAELDKPYQQYPGNRVAGFAPEQQQAFNNVVANQGNWTDLFNDASAGAGAGGQSWIDPGVSDAYMNPYTKGVTDVAARELDRNYGIQSKLRQGRAAQAGAFGDSQSGVAEAASQRDFMQQMSDLYTTGLGRAYDSGAQIFQGDRAAKRQSGLDYAGLAQLLPQLQGQDAAALESVGAQKQAQEQRGLDDAAGRFTEERDWNKNQLSWLASLMNSAQGNTTQTTSGGSGSVAGQAVGGATSLASLAMLASMAGMFSDRRLKRDIRNLGTDDAGLNVYRYKYKWSDREYIGYMADEVRKVAPWAVFNVGGYDAVNYGAL